MAERGLGWRHPLVHRWNDEREKFHRIDLHRSVHCFEFDGEPKIPLPDIQREQNRRADGKSSCSRTDAEGQPKSVREGGDSHQREEIFELCHQNAEYLKRYIDFHFLREPIGANADQVSKDLRGGADPAVPDHLPVQLVRYKILAVRVYAPVLVW